MAGTRHASYKSCIKIRSDYCKRFKKKHERLGLYKKKTIAKRRRSEDKRKAKNAAIAAAGGKTFTKRSYNRKALVAAFDAAAPAMA
jgi:hypothetical protein